MAISRLHTGRMKRPFRNKSPLGSVMLSGPMAQLNRVEARENALLKREIFSDEHNPPLVVAAESTTLLIAIERLCAKIAHKLLQGYMYKRAIKSGRNWKKRYVVCDQTSRSVYVFEDKDRMSKVNVKVREANASNTFHFTDETLVHPSGLRQFCIEILPRPGAFFVPGGTIAKLVRRVAERIEEHLCRWFAQCCKGDRHGKRF